MPAFDPVRDAALTSPVTQSHTLSPGHIQDTDIDRHERHPFDVPSPSSSRPSSRATSSPSLTRRATDLAVLLNSGSQGPRTPSSARPSSLSHLLLSDDAMHAVSTTEVNKLSGSTSLYRRSHLPTLDIPRDSRDNQAQYFPHQHHSIAPSRPFHGQHADTASHSASAPSSISRVVLSSPLASAPVMTSSQPSSASSNPSLPFSTTVADSRTTSSPDIPQPTPPATLPIPYNPRNRRTPAGSVLIPMTPKEMEMYRSYRGVGTQMLLSKRKRDRSTSPDNLPQPAAKRHAGDVGRVIEHCTLFPIGLHVFPDQIVPCLCVRNFADNMRPEVGVKQRLQSPIIGLKSFNNWVKSVLITRFAHPVLSSSTPVGPGEGRGKVLDMGCGKGGDLTKWEKARIRELVGVGVYSALIYHCCLYPLIPPVCQISLRSLLNKLANGGRQCVGIALQHPSLHSTVIRSHFPKHFHQRSLPGLSMLSPCSFACTTHLRLRRRQGVC